MWADFLAPPGIGFWIFSTLAVIVFFACLADGCLPAILSVLGYFVILHFFGTESVFGWLYLNGSPPAAVAEVVPQVAESPPDPSVFTERGRVFMAGVAAFFLVWGLWVILAAEIVFFSVCLRKRWPYWGMISMLVSLALLQFVAKIPVFNFIYEHPVKAALCFFGWAAIGFIWMWPYFARRVQKEDRRLNAKKDQFLKEKGVKRNEDGTLPRNLVAEFDLDWFPRNCHDDEGEVFKDLDPREHKAELTCVVAGWPLSMAEVFVFDLLINFFGDLVEYATVGLEKLKNRMWARHTADLATPEEQVIYVNKKRAAREVVLREQYKNDNNGRPRDAAELHEIVMRQLDREIPALVLPETATPTQE